MNFNSEYFIDYSFLTKKSNNEIMHSMEWGGSGIERVVFDYILDNFTKDSVIVEIGAGKCSTRAFSLFFDNVYSIEDDEKYIDLYKNVNYIHAPIINEWYDIDIVSKKLPCKIDLVFVDGPVSTTGNRSGIMKNIEHFQHSKHFILHDTWRKLERNLAISLSKKLNKTVEFFDKEDYWAVIK